MLSRGFYILNLINRNKSLLPFTAFRAAGTFTDSFQIWDKADTFGKNKDNKMLTFDNFSYICISVGKITEVG